MATFHERITGTGEGVVVHKTGTPKEPELTKHFVGTDHLITEEEAMEMGRALFDAIASQQAEVARAKKD